MEYYKIPNLKHQITNKSQTSISNDQNIHRSWSVSFRNAYTAENYAICYQYRPIILYKFQLITYLNDVTLGLQPSLFNTVAGHLGPGGKADEFRDLTDTAFIGI